MRKRTCIVMPAYDEARALHFRTTDQSNWNNLRLAAGLPRLHDCTSAYQCIATNVLVQCDLRALATRQYSFQSLLLSELIRNGARVVEIPILFGPRAHGTSKEQKRCLTPASSTS
jgi:hypothetical protein